MMTATITRFGIVFTATKTRDGSVTLTRDGAVVGIGHMVGIAIECDARLDPREPTLEGRNDGQVLYEDLAAGLEDQRIDAHMSRITSLPHY